MYNYSPIAVLKRLCIRGGFDEKNKQYILNNMDFKNLFVEDLRRFPYVPGYVLENLPNVPKYLGKSILYEEDNINILLRRLNGDFNSILLRSDISIREILRSGFPDLISRTIEFTQGNDLSLEEVSHISCPEKLSPDALQILYDIGYRSSKEDENLILSGVSIVFNPEKLPLYLHHDTYNLSIANHIIQTQSDDTLLDQIIDIQKTEILMYLLLHYLKTPENERKISKIIKHLTNQQFFQIISQLDSISPTFVSYYHSIPDLKDRIISMNDGEIEYIVNTIRFNQEEILSDLLKEQRSSNIYLTEGFFDIYNGSEEFLLELAFVRNYDISGMGNKHLENRTNEFKEKYLEYIMNKEDFSLFRYHPIYRMVSWKDDVFVVVLNNPDLDPEKIPSIPDKYKDKKLEIAKYSLRFWDPNFRFFQSHLISEDTRKQCLRSLEICFNKGGFLDAFLLLQKLSQ